MRKPVQKIYEWIVENQEDGWSIEMDQLIALIQEEKIIQNRDGALPAAGSVMRYVYLLSGECPQITIKNRVIHYNPRYSNPSTQAHPVSEDTKEKLEEFINLKKSKLIRKWEEEGNVVIDLHGVYNFDIELFNHILKNPIKTRSGIEYILQSKVMLENCSVNFQSAYPPDEQPQVSRNLTADEINSLVTLHAVPTRVDSARPSIKDAVFYCNKCNTKHSEPQQGEGLIKPLFCSNCKRREFGLVLEESIWTDRQDIELTEPLSRLDGSMGESLNAYLDGKTHLLTVGEECEITGTLEAVPTKGGNRIYNYALGISSIHKAESEIELTEDDIEIIQAYAKDPKIFKILEKCIAPFIWGYKTVKLGMLLQAFGCPSYLFQGERKRGNIHVLLIGDPSLAKSKLLTYMSYLMPKSIYVSGKGATPAGITATAEQTEKKGWRLKAGAMVLASGGLLCLDEFNECGRKVQRGLNEGMENGYISIAKAGITTRLMADTNILAAANPVLERFDSSAYTSLSSQYNIPYTTLSRFDLIFPMKDTIDETRDREISSHMVKGWRKEFEDLDLEIDCDMLRKYIQYSRQINPLLSSKAGKKIEDYYVEARKSGSEDRIPITARVAESVIRLSSAAAKIRLNESVSEKEIDMAILLVNSMLQETATDVNGQIDIDTIYTSMPASERKQIITLEDIIKKLIVDSNDRTAILEDIFREAEGKDIDKFKAEKILTELKTKGIIYEPRHGRFMFTEG